MSIEYLIELIVVVLVNHAHRAVVVPLVLLQTPEAACGHSFHQALLPPQHGVVQRHVPRQSYLLL